MHSPESSSSTPPTYSSDYFRRIEEGSRHSAEVVVPLVIDLVSPESVIDVGCGTGAWLSVFVAHGVSDVAGVDGDYIDRRALRIPVDLFIPHDLEQRLTLDRSFDLVVSLEVAEHLSADAAERFVESLTSLGPVILFSAAVPGQGGDNHVNEQWPSYWADLFAARGYLPIDCLRDELWGREEVEWWYSQNTILYAQQSYIRRDPRLSRALQQHGGRPRSLVHPRALEVAALTRQAADDVARIAASGDPCVLIDDGGLPVGFVTPPGCVRFMERDGVYWGPPADSAHALAEMESLSDQSASRVIVTWASFWWRDYYVAFFDHLSTNFHLAEQNEAVMIFDVCRPPTLDG